MNFALPIHGLSVGGDGVGRLPDGRVVFVAGTIPGDTVEVTLTHVRKRVQYADLLRIVSPSSDRVESRCPVVRCGGCPLRHMSVARQADQKRQNIIEAMRRIGGIEVDPLLGTVAQFGDGWTNRHRVRLHTAWSQERWQLGYYERSSRALVPLSQCPVVWPEVERLALSLGHGLTMLPKDAELGDIDLAYSRRDGRGAARIQAKGPMALFRQSLAWFEASGLGAVDIVTPKGRYQHGNLELRYDHARVDKFDIRYEPGLFTQANVLANDALIAAVVQATQMGAGSRVLELHAGIGNFTVPLARAGAEVVAYEQHRRAAILCERNASAPGLQVQVHAKSDVTAMHEPDNFDTVVLDPPRTGANDVMPILAQRRQQRIIYVACDPATLARDTAVLLAQGWRLALIQAFDMFPQTTHVETLCFFDRA